jgi:hypothetical protein
MGPRFLGGWLVDADQVAGRVADGAVPRAPRLVGRLLDDLGTGGDQPVEAGVEIVAVEVDAVEGALGDESGDRLAIGSAAVQVVGEDDRDAGLGAAPTVIQRKSPLSTSLRSSRPRVSR